ncbi:hypothetical protein AVEN_14089-1 [Araneus ventricosus]|uniref:Uncharacterized protein n=1 Tax=Araneus ventricosus TaxID=182803 RepID=A0A4Y2FW00_ARAVE|nr:hypothetical protein AVEN_14089-1 [Araneus ventricosus]
MNLSRFEAQAGLGRPHNFEPCRIDTSTELTPPSPTLLKTDTSVGDQCFEAMGNCPGLMVCDGIFLGGRTDLHVFRVGTPTGVKYRDEIFYQYVRPYAGAVGEGFMLSKDNAHPYRINEYLEKQCLEKMD